MNINLKIEDYDVELGTAELDFALNRTYEELSNPTVICNDWSKTISIPFSVTNNAIFGSIFNVERKLLRKDNYPNVGTNFNASRKANFTLWYNSGLLMTGYAKLASVDNVKMVYNINLFGEVGNTFLDLLECTFNKGTDVDAKYIIEDYIPSNVVINRNLIANSWRNDSPQLELEGAGTTDIVGFAPVAQGLPKGFQADTYLNFDGSFKKLADILNASKSITYGDSIIKDGLTEQAMRQFRTRFQKPYIYVNKLWQIMVEQSKKICKYPLYLDPIWFNKNNPYYTDLIYLCTDLSENDNGGTYMEEEKSRIYNNAPTTVHYKKTVDSGNLTLIINSGMADVYHPSWSDKKNFNYFHIYYESYLLLTLTKDGTELGKLAVSSNYREGRKEPFKPDASIECVEAESDLGFGEYVLKANFSVNLSDLPDEFDITYEWKYNNSELEMPYAIYEYRDGISNVIRVYEGQTLTTVGGTKALVSKDLLTLTRIWNPDVSPFEVLLNYAKMFGLIFETDHKNKRINVTCRNVYFSRYEIEDWTDKVNTINTFSIEQPTFANKYVMFNYDSIDDGRYKSYADKYQMEYGAKKLITEYEFNNDTENLYEGIKPTNAINETYSSYKDIFENWVVGHQIPRHTSTEVMLDNEGKDGSLNLYSAFAFRRKNQPLDSYYGNAVFITDDTIYEKNTDTYCYYDTAYYAGNRERMTSMPFLHYIDESGLYSCLFNVPKEVYVTNKDEVEGATCIYDAFWRDYINERYDAANKKLTAEINLSSLDYADFRFNKLVKINNTLYVVNAIKDYGVDDGLDTEVELITINNLNGYKDGKTFQYACFDNNFLTVPPSYEELEYEIKTSRNYGSQSMIGVDTLTSNIITIEDRFVEMGNGSIKFKIKPYTASGGIIIARTLYINIYTDGALSDTLTITQLSNRRI